ncbi:hypothetical protein EYZ11_008399 [Aspergillus tanneri]|uniref:Uncharacterized protein n=1 Tax=Aspergillus tanneri TaxID=1220188 RepID=A0A4S3JG16_9EURO|nr:hypothetical protein EYZ11_008399 [Aspergillus tanneri]
MYVRMGNIGMSSMILHSQEVAATHTVRKNGLCVISRFKLQSWFVFRMGEWHRTASHPSLPE